MGQDSFVVSLVEVFVQWLEKKELDSQDLFRDLAKTCKSEGYQTEETEADGTYTITLSLQKKVPALLTFFSLSVCVLNLSMLFSFS